MSSRARQDSTLLLRHEVELLDSVQQWAEEKFKKVQRVREIYSADHRPKVECQVLLELMKSVENVKDFNTVPP